MIDCDKCRGTGAADFAGFGLDTCRWCNGSGAVKQSLTVQAQERLEGLRQWADDDCPEGVAGIPDDVRWLLTYAGSVAAADLKQRLSDAVTLLYTHGVITEKMRAHARRNL